MPTDDRSAACTCARLSGDRGSYPCPVHPEIGAATFAGPVVRAEHPAAYTLALDEYEVANLREGLLFLREIGGDTGDWMGQILMKLPAVERLPNKPVQQQKRELATNLGWRTLWPTR